MVWLLHEWQKILPQKRQWWRRVKSVKAVPQEVQARQFLSGIQYLLATIVLRSPMVAPAAHGTWPREGELMGRGAEKGGGVMRHGVQRRRRGGPTQRRASPADDANRHRGVPIGDSTWRLSGTDAMRSTTAKASASGAGLPPPHGPTPLAHHTGCARLTAGWDDDSRGNAHEVPTAPLLPCAPHPTTAIPLSRAATCRQRASPRCAQRHTV
jgi:hypothetical protein